MGTEDDPVVRKVKKALRALEGRRHEPRRGPDLSMFNRFSKTFRKGDIIFCEYEPGDTFYLIQAGRVQIVRIIGDLEKNIDILNPAEVFGEMAILEEAPRSATTIALDEVKALEFNRENFEVLMMGNPQIAMKLLKLFIKRIYDQKRRFMILTLDDVEAKVADVFLMLAENQSVGHHPRATPSTSRPRWTTCRTGRASRPGSAARCSTTSSPSGASSCTPTGSW